MKKNNKGFTLIELLAVITIMGILMLVGIPAIGRTIENVRRDSFANITAQYVDAVRNAINADDLQCKQSASDDWTAAVTASGAKEGKYYVTIYSQSTKTQELMEKGGKSPYGNAEMVGYVKFVKTTDGAGKSKTVYSVRMQDTGKHGLRSGNSAPYVYEFAEGLLKRSNVVSDTGVNTFDGTDAEGKPKPNADVATPPASDGALECQVS